VLEPGKEGSIVEEEVERASDGDLESDLLVTDTT
jgi:hypothetical protein